MNFSTAFFGLCGCPPDVFSPRRLAVEWNGLLAKAILLLPVLAMSPCWSQALHVVPRCLCEYWFLIGCCLSSSPPADLLSGFLSPLSLLPRAHASRPTPPSLPSCCSFPVTLSLDTRSHGSRVGSRWAAALAQGLEDVSPPPWKLLWFWTSDSPRGPLAP